MRFLLSEQGGSSNGQLLPSNGGFPQGHLPTSFLATPVARTDG